MRKAGNTLLAICCCLAVFGLAGEARAASRNDVVRRLEEFRRFFVDFQVAPDSAVPGDLLAECYGVIIMRQYKAGFVFGVRGGDGVIFLRDRYTGAWSAPAFIASAEGSFGFQIGGQAIDAIMLIMNQNGVDMLLKSRFKIGVDASAAAGPVGRDASAKVGPGTAILAYSRAKGLYAGVAFEGGAMLNNDKYNRAMYGIDIGIRDILINNRVAVPSEAYPMIETLQSYSGVPVQRHPPIPTQNPAVIGQPPLPEPGPTNYYESSLSRDVEQAELDQAAAQAALAAQEATEAARAAQEAADAAAGRAAAGRGQ